jgi:hypothetical protein
MRALAACLSAACLLATVPAASAYPVTPKSAPVFLDSVGVVTHAVYYDTAYGNWPKVVARLRELGVRHVRDGVYANPTLEWRDWNERYYRAIDLAAAQGIRFTFGMGSPGSQTGTVDELVAIVANRLRSAAEALEAPNEFDKYGPPRHWRSRLSAYGRELYRKAKANPSLRSLPVLGPSFATTRAPKLFGDQRSWMDVGNVHPYTGGLSPDPDHLRTELRRARAVSGGKPVWATEVGFHNAMRATSGQPPVSESVAAMYLLRTFLEDFRSGIRRTFAYELVDEKPERARRDPEQHFGLLRHDMTRKPAFNALKNLLKLVGRDDRRPSLRPIRLDVSSKGADVRRLVLQKADGTYLVALWRLASAWDRDRQRPLRVRPRPVTVTVPGAARVAVADPVVSPASRRLRLQGGRVHLQLAGRPLVLSITP